MISNLLLSHSNACEINNYSSGLLSTISLDKLSKVLTLCRFYRVERLLLLMIDLLIFVVSFNTDGHTLSSSVSFDFLLMCRGFL